MARLVTLEKDGPLGPAGTQVWVDDEAPEAPEKKSEKKPEKKQASAEK